MRAYFVNEKFEKTSDAIFDIGIGGINFQEEFDKVFKEWVDFMKSSLEGKTIKAFMTKHYIKDHEPVSDTAVYTIKPKSIDIPTPDSFGGGHAINWKIYIDAEDNTRYSLYLDQKIMIR